MFSINFPTLSTEYSQYRSASISFMRRGWDLEILSRIVVYVQSSAYNVGLDETHD